MQRKNTSDAFQVRNDETNGYSMKCVHQHAMTLNVSNSYQRTVNVKMNA